VVSDFGLPELGNGFSPTYRPYRPSIWRNTGVDASTLDSTSETKFIRSTRVAQAFNFVVGTTDINLVSAEPWVKESPFESNGISAFPNPNSGDFQIVAKDNIESVAIFDFMGRRVYAGDSNSGNSLLIKQNDWKPKTGLYLVQVKSKDQLFLTKVLIK
jgi:hypothetical protein